jgi:transcriptional regulator with XRE-family HTH domain
MTQEVMAERVGVSVPTLAKLENGDPSTSLATVLRALTVLGLADDIDLIAAQDTLGRELQDNALRRTNAAPRIRTTPAPRPPPAPGSLTTPSVPRVRPRSRKPRP